MCVRNKIIINKQKATPQKKKKKNYTPNIHTQNSFNIMKNYMLSVSRYYKCKYDKTTTTQNIQI